MRAKKRSRPGCVFVCKARIWMPWLGLTEIVNELMISVEINLVELF
jgi:hypothetical protein